MSMSYACHYLDGRFITEILNWFFFVISMLLFSRFELVSCLQYSVYIFSSFFFRHTCVECPYWLYLFSTWMGSDILCPEFTCWWTVFYGILKLCDTSFRFGLNDKNITGRCVGIFCFCSFFIFVRRVLLLHNPTCECSSEIYMLHAGHCIWRATKNCVKRATAFVESDSNGMLRWLFFYCLLQADASVGRFFFVAF